MEYRSVMKAALLIFLALTCYDFSYAAQSRHLQDGVNYVPDGIVVAVKATLAPLEPILQKGVVTTGISEIDQLNRNFGVYKMWPLFPGAERHGEPEMAGYYSINYAQGFELEQVLSAYEGLSSVDHVEPIGIHRVYFNPNDPYLSTQWAITKIDARQAWDVTQGSATIPLGIADTGVDWNHPDLDGNIWINSGDPIDGLDNDGNTYIDDYRGWDWVTGVIGWPGEEIGTPDNNPMDFYGHGTHVSGIASAETNNGTGVAGLGFHCPIMCLRIGWQGLDGNGYVRMDFAASAFYYAANEGARAVNCSWGSSYDGGLSAAVNYATNTAHGVVVVSAAGNDNNQTAPYLCSRTDVIAVAATNSADFKADFSSYGVWVDVSAPGVNIMSTYFDNDYAYLDGTSMAAPHVVGLVGLIRSLVPGMTRIQVQNQIINTTEDIDALNPSYAGLLGSGRINAYNAVNGLGEPAAVPVPISPISGVWLNTPRPTLVWSDTSSAANFHVQIDDATSFTSPVVNDSIGNTDTTFAVTDSLHEGTWYWRVRASNGSIWSAYCTTQNFRIDLRSPNATTLLTPAQGSPTNDRTPFFAWTAVSDVGSSGINKYFIQADTDSLFAAPLAMSDSTVYINLVPGNNLPADSRIFWRVRARDNAGNYAVWVVGSFIIDNTAPASPVGFNITPDGWSGNPEFTLTWTNPVDLSGISMSLYKVGVAPTSNYDTTGHFGTTSPATFMASSTGAYGLYLWLVDGAGNVSFSTAVRDSLRFDNTPPSNCNAFSPPISSALSFMVSWGGGTDIGSGLAGLFDVKSMDSVAGVWTSWLTLTDQSNATFTGVHGHRYYFEARVYDLVGNPEPFLGVAESETRVDTTYSGPEFVPGDANGSGAVNGIDVVYLVSYLKGGPAPPDPIFRADANGNCAVNGLDVIYLVGYLKGTGEPPIWGDCGPF